MADDSAPWANDAPVTGSASASPWEQDAPVQGQGTTFGKALTGALEATGEAGAHLASSIYAPLGGGLTYLGTLAATGGDTDAAEAVRKATTDALTYEPKSDAGKQFVNNSAKDIGSFVKPAVDKYTQAENAVGDVSPVAGAAMRTAVEGAPYLLGIKGLASPLQAGADALDSAATRAGAVVNRAAEEAPSGVEYDTNGTAISPAPASGPSAAAAAPPGGFTAESLQAEGDKHRAAAQAVKEPPQPAQAPQTAPGTAPATTPAENAAPAPNAGVTERFAKQLADNPDAAKAAYAALPDTDGGRIISTDIARDLSPDYNASPESRSALAPAVHEPASQLAKDMYAAKLKEAPAPGQDNSVVFTGGGTGAGKTSGMNGTTAGEDAARAQIVYDTNMNTYGSAKSKIEQALAAGKNVQEVYTYRDPIDAYVNGALPRAERTGRTVPLDTHIGTHEGAFNTVQQLAQDYAGDPRVKFTAIDNSRGAGNRAVIPLDQLSSLRDNKPWPVRADYEKAMLDSGKQFSPRVIRGSFGEDFEREHPETAITPAGDQVQGAQGGAGNLGPRGRGQPVGNEGGGRGSDGTQEAGSQAQRQTQPGGEQQNQVSPAATRAQLPELGKPVSFVKPADEGAAGGEVTPAEQAQRSATLAQVPGLGEIRKSALTGDYKSAGTDFQTSRLDTKAGRRMAGVIQNERNALRGMADDLVDRSGGTSGVEQSDRYARGQTISGAVDAIDTHLENRKNQLYEEARQRAAGKPIPALNNLNNYMKDNKSQFLNTVEGKQLLEGVKTRMQELGFAGKNDTFHPPTVEQAERFRQYLNDSWTPRTSRLVGALKDQLDTDVMQNAGEDLFKEARGLNAMRSTMLDQNGISKLRTPKDNLETSRAVSAENVPGYVTKLPADQFNHLVDSLKAGGMMPGAPQLAGSSAAALNEIRAQFANELKAAGTNTEGHWNAKAVNKYLEANNMKLQKVFSPDELQRMKVLNDAGAYLRMDKSYPGAAAQSQNFIRRGVVKGVEHAGTAAGALLGEVPGALVGAAVGKGVKAWDESAEARAVEDRISKVGNQ